jgi:hypothetical protein
MLNWSVKDRTLSEVLDSIAQSANLSWGRIGNEIILVTPNTMHRVYAMQPKLIPVPRFEHGSPAAPQPKPQTGWKPFEFNGNTYYKIPLQENREKAKTVQPSLIPTK